MDTSQRAAVSFTDVAASFSGEEWDILEEWQRHLYGNVMREIHNVLLNLGLGPDIMLRINYQGAEVEDPEQRVMKTELDSLPEVKQEKGIYDTGVPDTSQDEGPRSTPAMCTQSPSLPPGLVVYPVTVKKEAEDGGGDSQLSANSEWTASKTRATCKSRTTGDHTPEQTCRDRIRRRKGIAHQIKSVSGLHDSDQNKQAEPKENEAPRHPRLSPECEPSFTGIKLPFPAARPVEDVYPISFQQSGQTLIICSVCGMTFCNKSSFQVHMRTHTRERPYKCSYCDKSFIRSSHLKIHLRTHTGERPYKCPGCDKSFRDNSSFARHQRIHTGEKPYQCSTCGKYFRKKSNLKDHQRTHTGERPYMCKHCDKSFHQRSNLRVHERNHHRDS